MPSSNSSMTAPSTYGSSHVSSLSDLIAHPLHIQVVDSEGDVTWTSFMLVEASPHLIASLEGHTREVNSVAFRPMGADSLVGSHGQPVGCRHRAAIGFSAGIELGVFSVAFSPDGKRRTTQLVGCRRAADRHPGGHFGGLFARR